MSVSVSRSKETERDTHTQTLPSVSGHGGDTVGHGHTLKNGIFFPPPMLLNSAQTKATGLTEPEALQHLSDLHTELAQLVEAIVTNQPTNRGDAAAE